MWSTIFDLFFCPQHSIIYGSQCGIFRPENMALITAALQPLFNTGLAAVANAWSYVRRKIGR
jgi:hypothetical protein